MWENGLMNYVGGGCLFISWVDTHLCLYENNHCTMWSREKKPFLWIWLSIWISQSREKLSLSCLSFYLGSGDNLPLIIPSGKYFEIRLIWSNKIDFSSFPYQMVTLESVQSQKSPKISKSPTLEGKRQKLNF